MRADFGRTGYDRRDLNSGVVVENCGGIQVVRALIPVTFKGTMNLTITVELRIKGDEAEVFVNGKKVATVETDSAKPEEEKVSVQ